MEKFKSKLSENVQFLKEYFNNDENIIVRELENNNGEEFKFAVIYEKNMINMRSLAEGVIKPVADYKAQPEKDIFKGVENRIIIFQESMILEEVNISVEAMLAGKTILLIDGYDKALVVPTAGYQIRKVGDTITEKVVRGPKEGFTETLSTNVSLLRRKIPNEGFKVINKVVGDITRTQIAICYLEDQVDKDILKEVEKRIDEIDCKGILESNNIAESIENHKYSPFKTIGSTERPDEAAAKILEGKVIIICNGTPFVLTIPFLFEEYFQSAEDYYHNYIFSSINRILRALGFVLTISTPAIFLALVTFHGGMIPTKLAISISQTKEGVPFPPFLEAIIYILIFEFLRESSTRMPYAIGSTVGIVGALVIGQAAIMAKLVSPAMIIIVSFVGITTFMVIELKSASIIFRFIFLVLATILGLYGYLFGVMGLIYYLSTMESFGVPYLQHITFFDKKQIAKSILRLPYGKLVNGLDGGKNEKKD